MHLLWWHYGEGRWFSRSVTLAGLGLTLAALCFRRYALREQAAAADRISLYLVLLFGTITAAEIFISLWFLPFWPWRKVHPAGSLTTKHLLYVPPEPGIDSPYRFHIAGSVQELEPYVKESEYFLAEANPKLDTVARRALYRRWLELSPNSFLYLTRTDRACPVGLSIILPLTRIGYERLTGTSRPKKEVIYFGEEEIAKRGPYHYLLVDTFIISKKQEKSGHSTPTGKKRYGRTLIFRHLAFFWKDARTGTDLTQHPPKPPHPHSVVIIAETNKDKLIPNLKQIGFKSKGKSAIDCPLFEFQYPAAVPNVQTDALVRKLIQIIWDVRKWKVEINIRPSG